MFFHNCLIFLKRNPSAKFRLFMFHHAGGSHFIFRDWQPHFPEDWEICYIDLPGRGILMHETLLEDISDVLRYLSPILAPYLDIPFGFFGHSMGALIAYELIDYLHLNGQRLPRWLGLSARAALNNSASNEIAKQHAATDEHLIKILYNLGGIPKGTSITSDIWPHLLKIIRSDLKIVQTILYSSKRKIIDVPLFVCGGEDDKLTLSQALLTWKQFTTRLLTYHLYPGGHFYFKENKVDLIRDIVFDVFERANA